MGAGIGIEKKRYFDADYHEVQKSVICLIGVAPLFQKPRPYAAAYLTTIIVAVNENEIMMISETCHLYL